MHHFKHKKNNSRKNFNRNKEQRELGSNKSDRYVTNFNSDEEHNERPYRSYNNNTSHGEFVRKTSHDYQPQYNDQDYRGRLHSSPQSFDTQGQFSGGISDNYNIEANDFDDEYIDTYWMGKQYPKSMKTLGDDNSGRFFGEHSGKGPKGYKRSDERIYEEVCETLTHSPSIDASEIEVVVHDGCVHLKGTVNTRHLKRLAETCIENIVGIEDIQNELKVKKIINSYTSQADGVQSAKEPKEEDTNNSSLS